MNAEVKRPTDVVGTFPRDGAIAQPVDAILLEQNEEWELQRRYVQLEELLAVSDNQLARLLAMIRDASLSNRQESRGVCHSLGHDPITKSYLTHNATFARN